ncbi:2-amino-4-hydroxy-6-hydroxymethyldihydropteridine diphosphokinase [Candidatus Poribacteria bacterium]|nr:2-amino-4-hydroxy-6-hydroxymethyldihydropteridine diphosphokinase [Candidatus Poribacteria bacterium]
MKPATPVEAYIAVGSNIEPEKNILNALGILKRYVRVKASSTFYRTMPLGRPEQAVFLNGVWHIETVKTARALKFDLLRRIEAELGRVRTDDKYAARTIDLDIAVYGDEVINEPDIHLPDPDIRHRPFIAIPLLELAPALALPDTGEQLSSLPVTQDRTGLEPLDVFTASLRERIKL